MSISQSTNFLRHGRLSDPDKKDMKGFLGVANPK